MQCRGRFGGLLWRSRASLGRWQEKHQEESERGEKLHVLWSLGWRKSGLRRVSGSLSVLRSWMVPCASRRFLLYHAWTGCVLSVLSLFRGDDDRGGGETEVYHRCRFGMRLDSFIFGFPLRVSSDMTRRFTGSASAQ